MSKKKIPPQGPAPPLDDEVMKGVWVDGVTISLGADHVILDGHINPPRSEKRVTVVRMLFPSRVIPTLIEVLRKVEEGTKKMKPTVTVEG